jgi:hypothetical protein
VTTEGALDLPPLAEHPLVPVALFARAEVPGHLGAVLPARFAFVAAWVDRDHTRADPQIFPREPVVRLGIERGVGQHPVPGDAQGGQEQNGCELRGVVGRTEGDGGPGDEVGVGIDGGAQLGPGAGRVLALGAGNEVSGGVAAVQAGGIDGDGGLIGDQFGRACGRDGAFEEVDEGPPFSSRPSALQTVE